MSDVPDEVIAEILSRLPVEPLLRFRCVSKSWRATIGSKDFIKKHLTHSLNTNSIHSLISRFGLYSAHFDALDKTNCANFQQLNHPLKSCGKSTEILGSCNGLLCISNSDKCIVLWNPSTRKYRNLPVAKIGLPKAEFRRFQCIIYGFGYDFVNDDYKLVRVVHYEDTDEVDSEVAIYSLKSDSWKRVRDFPYYFVHKRGYGIFANGALHWVVCQKPTLDTARLIAAFDLGTEEYSLIPQPEYFDENFHMNVAVLGGCLCVICNYYLGHVDIWVMKEYGVKESWTNLMSVRQCDVQNNYFEFVWPIAYSKCGKQVLLKQDYRFLVWYDLENKSIKSDTILIHTKGSYCDLDVIVGSLVRLNGGSCKKDGKSRNKYRRWKRKKSKEFLPKNNSEERYDFQFQPSGIRLVID